MAMKRIVLVVLLGVVARAGVLAAEPLVELQTGIPFPDRLASMTREAELTKYSTRAMGYGVRYNGPDRMKADVYVYDGGFKSLGTGQIGEAVRAHWEECKDAIFTFEKRGRYRAVKHLGDEQITLEAGSHRLPMLHSKFQYSEVRTNEDLHRRSHILLTTYKDTYLKIRLTYFVGNAAEGERIRQALLDDLGRVLAAHWDSPAPPRPLWITIVNPATNSGTIGYTLNGARYQIAPGESQKLDYKYVIEFDQGAAKGLTSYTLGDDGVYRFTQDKDGSWTLVRGDK